jgi:glycerol-3-phosphate acyltransferase PlsY
MTTVTFYLLACFLIGSVPLGEIFARIKSGKSIIQPGSRNTIPPGEMFEILGIPAGIIVCLLDGAKGFVNVFPLAIYFLGPDPYSRWWVISLAGLLTVIGHCNSPFLGFKGGRGLAPTFGVMATLLPVPAFISLFLGLWLAFWGLSSKPGALSAAGAMPLLSIAWVMGVKPENLDYLYVVAFMSLWTMWEHREELKNYMGMKSSSDSEKITEQ